MRANYIVIPLITVAVALIGSRLTSGGMDWYQTIPKPSFTPPGSVIGAVWTIIFILATISALMVWNSPVRKSNRTVSALFPWIVIFFLLNAFLNVFWSFLFFNQHMMYAAIWEAIALDITVIVLVLLIWPISRLASLLLLPYAAWVAFASYLTWIVWALSIIFPW